MSYKRLDNEDVLVSAESITSPAWTNNTVKLVDFFESATQKASTSGDYYLDVYNANPASDNTAEVQFAIAYGDSKGSGSVLFNGNVEGNSPSSVIYKQVRTQLLGTEESLFQIDGSDAESIYVISLERSRFKEKLLPGSLSINIDGTVYTDDSSTTTTDTFSDTGRVYNIINSVNEKKGLIYPDAGILILSGSVTGSTGRTSNTDDENYTELFNGLNTGENFTLRTEETVTSNYVFIRARNSEFNYSTNPSYITGSGELRHSELIDNPQAYISTVGLYNDNNELLAVAKLSRTLLKDFTKEALLRVKLDY